MRKMMMISDDDKAERRRVADAGMDVGWVDPWDGLTHGLGWIGYEWQYMVIFTALVRVKVVPQRLSQGRMFIRSRLIKV